MLGHPREPAMIAGRGGRSIARCGKAACPAARPSNHPVSYGARCATLSSMDMKDNARALEAGIHTDLTGRLSYGGYLRLDRLLSAQQPLSDPPHHDELLFIIQHQVSELWLKLLVHELRAAAGHLREGRIDHCQKIFSRCKIVLRQLTAMWSVLETLTPSEYAEFRDLIGASSATAG